MRQDDFITKCAWCGAIHLHKVWLPKSLERIFVKVRPDASISHGICKKCLKSHFLMAYNEIARHHPGSGRRPRLEGH